MRSSTSSSRIALQGVYHSSNMPHTSSQAQELLFHQKNLIRSGPLAHDVNFATMSWNLQHALPPSIHLAPEFEAVPFFFKNFIALPQQAESTRGYLEHLVPLYNRACPSSVLHLATTAVAMATCGQYPGRQQLLREAVATYGRAIKRLNSDLQDPMLKKSDETVLAILMFSLYEVGFSSSVSFA